MVMAVNATTGVRPARPIPANAAAVTLAEREAIQHYDTALAKSVAIIAQAAGDNYLEMTVPFLNANDPGGLWDELERRLAQRMGSSCFNAITQFFATTRTAGELWANLAGRIAAHRSRIQSLFPTNFTLIQFLDELETFQFLRAFPEDSVVRTTIIAQGNLDPAHVHSMVDMLITAPAHTAPDRANLAGFTPSKFPPCPWCSGTNHSFNNCYAYNDAWCSRTSLFLGGKRWGFTEGGGSFRRVFPLLWEMLPCFGGPEAAGKAPRTVEHQMLPAAKAQTQELAPKQVQLRQVSYYVPL
jgi:hypothetical protein